MIGLAVAVNLKGVAVFTDFLKLFHHGYNGIKPTVEVVNAFRFRFIVVRFDF